MVITNNLPSSLRQLNSLELSENQLQLLQFSHEPVWISDWDSRITFWNRSAETLLGWTVAQAVGQGAHELLRSQLPRPLADIKAQLEAEGIWEGRVTHKARDGRTIIFNARWSLQKNQQGAPVALLQFNQPLSDGQNPEEALRAARAEFETHVQARLAELDEANLAFVESQERFRQIADNIRDVVWLANPSMTSIIYVNPAYEEIWGRSREGLYLSPRGWLEGIHPEDRVRLRSFFDQPLREQEYAQTYRVVHPSGVVRWVLERGFPVRDNAERIYRLVGVVRDITEHRALEKEILAISEREQQRLGQDLHDDLCQQLVGIEFLSKALEQQLTRGARPAAPEQARASLKTYAGQAGEIAQLIRAAIGHTRVLARGLAPFGLESDGLPKALGALAARTSELFRIDCSLVCEQGVRIDELSISTNLYRIAQEAVTNSIKHGQATRVSIALGTVADGVCLEIKDNGIGLKARGAPSIGMGLRIMQYRADMMAATFDVHAAPDRGTVVVCTVPAASARAAEPAP